MDGIGLAAIATAGGVWAIAANPANVSAIANTNPAQPAKLHQFPVLLIVLSLQSRLKRSQINGESIKPHPSRQRIARFTLEG
jgi:hypothetical protein